MAKPPGNNKDLKPSEQDTNPDENSTTISWAPKLRQFLDALPGSAGMTDTELAQWVKEMQEQGIPTPVPSPILVSPSTETSEDLSAKYLSSTTKGGSDIYRILAKTTDRLTDDELKTIVAEIRSISNDGSAIIPADVCAADIPKANGTEMPSVEAWERMGRINRQGKITDMVSAEPPGPGVDFSSSYGVGKSVIDLLKPSGQGNPSAKDNKPK